MNPWMDRSREMDEMMSKYQPIITRKSYVMCTACQMACPYTSEERRGNSHMICATETD